MFFYLWRPGKTPGVDHELIWGSVGILALAMARFVPRQLMDLYVCPFRHFTGIPCLTCGMTRSFQHLVRLELGQAVALSPFGALFAVLTGLYVLYAIAVVAFPLPRVRVRVDNSFLRWTLRLGIPALLLANWVYMMIHGV